MRSRSIRGAEGGVDCYIFYIANVGNFNGKVSGYLITKYQLMAIWSDRTAMIVSFFWVKLNGINFFKFIHGLIIQINEQSAAAARSIHRIIPYKHIMNIINSRVILIQGA